MKSVRSKLNFIPAEITEMLENGIFGRRRNGYILIADISGFTAMTEELIRSGKSGCETLSDIINEIFEPAISHIYHNGGCITSFAGDAFTAVFEKNNYTGTVTALESIRDLFKTNTFGGRKLGVKISVGYGTFSANIIRTKNKNLYIYRGQAVERSVKCQKNLKKDGIGYEPESITRTELKKAETEKPFFTEKQLSDTTIYNSFLDKEFRNSHDGMKGEFREVVSVFIILSKYSQTRIADIADKTYECGGFLQKIDYGDKGIIIMSVFGAPVSVENKEKAALVLINLIKGGDISTGVSKGVVFAGNIGSLTRSEYTCLGSVINLSARLAAAAGSGRVITDTEFKRSVEKLSEFRKLEGIELKGIEKSAQYYIMESGDGLHYENQERTAVFGRESEYEKFSTFIKDFLADSKSAEISITGISGAGKTVFLNSIMNGSIIHEFGNKSLVFLECDIMKRPFHTIQSFLKHHLNKDHQWNSSTIRRPLHYFFDEALKFIFNEKTNNQEFDKLDSKNKYAQAITVTGEIILSANPGKPVFIIFEDVQNMEKTAESLIRYIRMNHARRKYCIISAKRTSDEISASEKAPEAAVALAIDIKPFGEDNTKLLAEYYLGSRITREFNSKIFDKTKGNPLFIGNICDYLKNKSFQITERGYALLRNEDIEAFNSISGLLLALADTLPEKEKTVLKTAAVIGDEFNSDDLGKISGLRNISDHIKHLTARNIFRIQDGSIRFVNPLLRNTIYETILKKDTAVLHGKTAKLLENKATKNTRFTAFHYEMSGDLDEAERFYRMSIESSYKNYRNEEAYESFTALFRLCGSYNKKISLICSYPEIFQLNSQFDKGIEIVNELENKSETGSKEKIILKNVIGQLYSSKLRYDDSIKSHSSALELAERYNDKSNTALSYLNMGNAYTGKYEYNNAEKYLKKANKIAVKNKFHRIIIRSLNNLGVIYTYKSDFIKAAKMFDKLNVMAEKHGDIYDILTSLVNIGFSNLYTSQYDKSEDALTRALKIAKDLNEKSKMAIILGNLGNLCEIKADFENGLKYFRELLLISEELDDMRNIAISHGNIGYILLEQGKFKEAFPHIQKQKEFAEKCGDKRHVLYAYQSLGRYYLTEEEYDKAFESYSRQLELAVELDDKINISVSKTNLENINELRYIYDNVEKGYLSLISDSLHIGDRRSEGQGYYTIANFYLKIGKHSEAEKYLIKLKDLADELKNDEFMLKYHQLKSLLLMSVKKYSDSEKAAKDLLAFSIEKDSAVFKIEAYFILAELSYSKNDGSVMLEYINSLSGLESYESNRRHSFEFNLLKVLQYSLSNKEKAEDEFKKILKSESLPDRLGRVNKELYLLTGNKKYKEECDRLLIPIYEKCGDVFIKDIIDK